MQPLRVLMPRLEVHCTIHVFMQMTLAVAQEELESRGHCGVNYDALNQSVPLLEAVPDLERMLIDKSELLLSAMGVAFSKVRI